MDKLGRLTTKDYSDTVFPTLISKYENGEIDFYTLAFICRDLTTLRYELANYIRHKDPLKITTSEYLWWIKSDHSPVELTYSLTLKVEELKRSGLSELNGIPVNDLILYVLSKWECLTYDQLIKNENLRDKIEDRRYIEWA